MKGQSYILEYIIMFGVVFFLFAFISYLFYSQTDFLSNKIGENLARLVNKGILMNLVKSNSCKNCNMTIYQEIPEKIGGFNYNISFKQQNIQVILLSKRINNTHFNLNETFNFLGNTISNNKKIEIQINNKIIQVN